MTTHIGLVGGGNITVTHARAARAISGVEISAIHGTNAEKIAHLCREYGGTPYHDFDAFLQHRPLDFVVIRSPSRLPPEKTAPPPPATPAPPPPTTSPPSPSTPPWISWSPAVLPDCTPRKAS